MITNWRSWGLIILYLNACLLLLGEGDLETNGIEAVIFGDGLQQTIGAGAHIFPVSVMVKNSDKDAAEKLINEQPVD